MTYETKVSEWTRGANLAARELATASSAQKNAVLARLAELLLERESEILAANTKDVERCRQDLSEAQIDRLVLTPARIAGIAAAVHEVQALPDPVGTCGPATLRPNGLRVMQMRIPLGVILMIFESRPNVIIDAGVLCLKSGNAAILRGGRETLETGAVFAGLFAEALAAADLPAEAVTVVDSPDRALVGELLTRSEEIDLVIPRGGEGLIRAVTEQSRIPVIQHFKGVCHTYIHASAAKDRAMAIALNGKTHRTGVCNATETILVDAAWQHAGALIASLQAHGVEVRGCERVQALAQVVAAAPADWDTEYLAMIVAVRIVDDIEEAIAHIADHGSNHTEAIVATDWDACLRFQNAIQSSTVVVNASTRFADGGELGLGAEIGISTSKLHAYGPMGLNELTTKKFVVHGQGQIRE